MQHGLELLKGAWGVAGQEVRHRADYPRSPGCNTGKPATKNLGQNEARCCRVEISSWCVVGVRGLRLGVAAGGSISLSY